MPDPDLVAESLEVLWLPYAPPRQGTRRSLFWRYPMDAYWHVAAEVNLKLILGEREKQLAFLARYAKQNLLQWDDVPVTEIRKWCLRISDLLKAEHGVQRGLEQDS